MPAFVAVTVDTIATGTDIKPLEIVLFICALKSRVFFEQMNGHGVRVIRRDGLQSVLRITLAKRRIQHARPSACI